MVALRKKQSTTGAGGGGVRTHDYANEDRSRDWKHREQTKRLAQKGKLCL